MSEDPTIRDMMSALGSFRTDMLRALTDTRSVLGEGLSRVEDRMSRLEAAQEAQGVVLLQARAALMARIDRLSNEVSSFREDLAVNYGASSDAQRTGEAAQTDVIALRQQLRLIEGQVQRLQVQVADLQGRAH